jgi:serine/threonine protein kinase
MVHCDVKLENMLLDGSAIKLCDFGLAGFVGDVRHGKPFGTSPYMSPEIVHLVGSQTTHTLTVAQDVWSFGVVLYAVLFNDLPWEKAVDTDPEYAAYAFPEFVDYTSECTKNMEQLSPTLRTLLVGMLTADPAQRVTMSEVVAFLSEARHWFVDDEVTMEVAGAATAVVEGEEHGIPVVRVGGGGGACASASGAAELFAEDSTPVRYFTQRSQPVRLQRSSFDPRRRSQSFAGVGLAQHPTLFPSQSADKLTGNRVRSHTTSVIKF